MESLVGADGNVREEDLLNSVLRIRMLKPTLTQTEQTLTEHILALGSGINDMTITEIAESNKVSEAMIVKLAQKLGFAGYRELKRALKLYNQMPVSELHREIDPEDNTNTIISKVFSTSIQALQETLSVLDMAQFERAVDTFYKARHREIYGVGGSASVAEDASHKFLRIGIHCPAYTDAHTIAMSASLLGKGDVALCISYSGQTRDIVEAMRIARNNGATTIAFTNYLNSPLAENIDIVLLATSRGSKLTGENAAARIAQLCLVDSIFVAVAQKNYDMARRNLEKTTAAVASKRLHR